MANLVIKLADRSENEISLAWNAMAHRIATEFDNLLHEMNAPNASPKVFGWCYEIEGQIFPSEPFLEHLIVQQRTDLVPSLENLVRTYIQSEPSPFLFHQTSEVGTPAMYPELHALLMLSPEHVDFIRDYFMMVSDAGHMGHHVQQNLVAELYAKNALTSKKRSALEVFFLLTYLSEGGNIMDFGDTIVLQSLEVFNPADLGDMIAREFKWFEADSYGYFIEQFGMVLSHQSDYHGVVTNRLKQELG